MMHGQKNIKLYKIQTTKFLINRKDIIIFLLKRRFLFLITLS